MWEEIAPGDSGDGSATKGANGATVTHQTEWDAADGSGVVRDNIGVGERVFFTADVDGTWRATTGTRAGSGQRFTWTAPGTASSATITFTPSGGDTAVTKTLSILAPTRVALTKISDDALGPGTMGAGFRASVALHPLNVSFAATEWKEDTGQAGENAQGYFADKALPTHTANPNWLGIGAGNSGRSDHVAFGGFPSPWSAGSFQWSIAQRWKLRSASEVNLIETLAQMCVLEGIPHAGRTTVSKGGAFATQSPSRESETSDGEGRGAGWGSEADGDAARDADGYGIGDSRPEKRSPTSWEIVNKHDVKFISAIADRIKANEIPHPHQRLTWASKDDARQAIGARILKYVRGLDGQVLKRLMMLCPTTDLYAVVDDARRGPDGTRVEVAVIRVAAAFDEPLRQSIMRMGMRTVVQIDKENGIRPRDTEVIASSALDGIIVEVILESGRATWVPRKKGAPNDTGKQSFKDGARGGKHERVAYTWMGGRDKNLWNWIHVTEPKNVTAEDVAQFDLLKNYSPNSHSEEAYRIAASPPYFGIPVETAQLIPDARRHAPEDVLLKLDTADPGSRIADGGALARSAVSDEAAMKSAPRASKSDLPIARAIDRTKAQLSYMQGALEPWKVAAPLKGASDFVARRASEAISDPKSVERYAPAMAAQERILNAASSELGEILRDLEVHEVTAAHAKAIAPVVEVLRAYATAAGTSHLYDAAQDALGEARRRRKLLPLSLAEAKIKSASEQLVAQRKTEEGVAKVEEHSADNLHALPKLTQRAADLRFAAAQGSDLDPDDVERLTLDASVVELRARLVTLGTQTRTLRGRADDVGLAKGKHPGGTWSVDMVCELILNNINYYQERLNNAHAWTGPGYDKKLNKLNTKQTENQKLRQELKTTESLFSEFAKVNVLYKVKGEPNEDFFTWAYNEVKDKQLANLIASIAIQVGVAVISGQVVGAVGATIRGLTAAAEIGASLRQASLLYRGASIVVQAGVQTGTQAALGQDVRTSTFAENALGLVLTSAAMKPFQALLDNGAVVEQQIVKGWVDFAKKSGKFVLEAAIDAGAGITAAALARTIVHGGKLDMSNSEEWITQGLSFAANRMVHGHAMKMYSRLETAGAKWGVEVTALKQKVLDLANKADKITKPTPEQALEQLARRHEYLVEERRLLDGNEKARKTRSANGDRERALEEQAAQVEQFADVPLQLAGLSPIVPGHVYEGSKAQIDRAIAKAKEIGVDFRPVGDARYKVGKRVITIQEMGGTAARSGKLNKQADALGSDVTPIDDNRFRVNKSSRLDEIRGELAGKGNKVGEIKYDAATNTAYFEMTATGSTKKVRLESSFGKITSVDHLQILHHHVIGDPVDAKVGHELIAKLNSGDPYALAQLGVAGEAKFPKRIEYGLGDIGGGKVIVVRGGSSVIDWAFFPGVKPIAHTHPPVELRGGSVKAKEVFTPTDEPLLVREQIFPSGADFIVMAQQGISGHVVYTEFILKDGQIMNAPSGDKSPRLNFTITRSRRYGINGNAEAVYLSTMEMRAGTGTKPIETVDVWTVQPRGSDTGNLFMKKPKGVQETKPDGSPLAAKTRSTSIAEASLKNLKNGLDDTQVESLVTRHDPDVVEWAGKSLDGAKARALLDGLQAKTIDGLRDVAASDAHSQLTAFGAATLDKIVPPVTGTHLRTQRTQLGDTTAKGLIKDKIDRGKIPDIVNHATQLATATARPSKPMQAHSIAVDSNVIIAIQDVTGPTPKKAWNKLAPGERAAINYLRSMATPTQLPQLLPTDTVAVGTTAAALIGGGHDLRASNVTRGETKPTATMPVGELPITVSRNGAAYNKVLSELEANNIGKGKGGADRGVVADAIFAAGNAKLMTADHSVIVGLYDTWGVKTRAVTQGHKEKRAAAIARIYAADGGFDANVPNGSGGTRRIRIIPGG